MTNEEAREELRCFRENMLLSLGRIEALDMAIKALEQQPSEDCISREAVNVLIDELARAISDERCCISRGRSTATIMRDILQLPSVTPKGVTVTDFANKCRECGKIQNELAEDAVSREEGIEGLTELINNLKRIQGDMGGAVNSARELIKALPSVTPQPKVGKLIPRNSFLLQYKCSECGCELGKCNFCSNCGAKMEEEER